MHTPTGISSDRPPCITRRSRATTRVVGHRDESRRKAPLPSHKNYKSIIGKYSPDVTGSTLNNSSVHSRKNVK